MSRKRSHRIPRTPLPPPGLRRKLDKSQRRDLALVHINNLDAIARGHGNEEVLWDWIGAAMTWSFVASALEKRDAERYREAAAPMRLQLDVATAVVDRYARTGRVCLAGPEYVQAKDAVEWMDALAEVVDQPTASLAADWSEARRDALARKIVGREEAAA